jgi:hypothetical protein
VVIGSCSRTGTSSPPRSFRTFGQSVERKCCQHGQALKAAFVVLVELAAIGLVRQLEEALIATVLADDRESQQAAQRLVAPCGVGVAASGRPSSMLYRMYSTTISLPPK